MQNSKQEPANHNPDMGFMSTIDGSSSSSIKRRTKTQRKRRKPGPASAAAATTTAVVALTLTATSSLLGEAAAVVAAAVVIVPNCGCCSAFVSYGLQATLSRSFPCCRADFATDFARSSLGKGVPRSWQRDRPLLPVNPAIITDSGRRRRRNLVAATSTALQAAASLRISRPDCNSSSSSSSRNRRTRLFCSVNNAGKDSRKILTEVVTASDTPKASATIKDEVCAASKSSRDIAASSWKLEVDNVALDNSSSSSNGSDRSSAAAVAAVIEEAARANLVGSSIGVRLQRRNQLASMRLRTTGQDVSFEFSDMREAIPLPCRSIQLFPRADRRSLVYVDGKQLSGRRTAGVNATGNGGNPGKAGSSSSSSVTTLLSPESPVIGTEILPGPTVASVGLASATGGSNTGSDVEFSAGVVDESKCDRIDVDDNVWGSIEGGEEAETGSSWRVEGHAGDSIRLVGEMEISKPAYLQVQEGGNGRSEALLVTQFGLTRGGALLRIDLDPPSPPPLFPMPPLLPRFAGAGGRAATVVAVATSTAAAAAAAVATEDTSSRCRAQLRITDDWDDPFVWPNQVNEVPPSAVVRLTRGEDAEARFLAHTRREGGVDSGRERGGGGGGGKPSSVDRGGKSLFAPLGRDEFNLLRVESDNFVNRVDVSDSPLRPHGLSPRLEENASRGRNKNVPGVEGVSGEERGEGNACPPPNWDGSLPPRAVLVADGFLVPGKADGGVYVVIPSLSEEGDGDGGGGGGEFSQSGGQRREQDCTEGRVVRLTRLKRGWFYHKAVWVELPRSDRKAVLTARARKPLFGPAEGELVLLEMPLVNYPLAEQNLPWRETVLAKGPDVIFEVVDLDPTDSTVQVMCAEFFGGRVTMHSLWGGGSLPGGRPSVTESWVLDEDAGPAYSVIAADLRSGSPGGRPTHLLVTTHESSYGSYSPGAAAAAWMMENSGLSLETDGANANKNNPNGVGVGIGVAVGASSAFGPGPGRMTAPGSQRLRRSSTDYSGGAVKGAGMEGEGEREKEEGVQWWERGADGAGGNAGGKLLAYEIPEHWRLVPNRPPGPGCSGWRRETLASGFRVRGISLNAGSPGFPYVFHPHKSMEGKRPPYIAVAGDCSQAAYILRPVQKSVVSGSDLDSSVTIVADAATARGASDSEDSLPGEGGRSRAPLKYEVACTIEVPGTVGSLAVGYGRILGERLNMASPSPETKKAEEEKPSCNAVRAERSPHTLRQVEHEVALPQFPADPTVRDGPILDERCLASAQGSGVENGDIDSAASGWAKLYIPNYDGNKLYVFSMGPSLQQRPARGEP